MRRLCGVSHISGPTNLLSKDVFGKIKLWFWPSRLFLLGEKSKKCEIEEATKHCILPYNYHLVP